MKIAVHMWLGPYLPNIPRPVKPVRPTGFLKWKVVNQSNPVNLINQSLSSGSGGCWLYILWLKWIQHSGLGRWVISQVIIIDGPSKLEEVQDYKKRTKYRSPFSQKGGCIVCYQQEPLSLNLLIIIYNSLFPW